MLVVTLGKPKQTSTTKARLARRVGWQYPPGVRVLGEYWLESVDPTLIVISEVDDPAALMRATADWDDHFDLTTTPAISADQGMALAEQMSAG